MPLAQAKCKNCGAVLEVDTSMETAVCPYCGTPYIVEKTIKNYNANFNITNQIRTDTVNIYGGSASVPGLSPETICSATTEVSEM